MRFTFYLICFFLINSGSAVYSQQETGAYLKKKYFTPEHCSFQVDDHTLIPSSIIVVNGMDTITDYTIQNNKIIFTPSNCHKYTKDTLGITYRTFGFDVEKPYFIIDSSQLTFKEKALISAYEYRLNQDKTSLIESSGLDYKGSFARGISVGNSQSLVINSNFDMQMVGDLGNGLRIVAAISDENLPIQAAGNTQQLQEFDKVFIQVSKDRTSVTAGDYDLRRPNSYFMNYFKKLKGITLATTFNTTKNTEVFTKGSFAISRGKFARQFLSTSEGNQGPYRLQGNNGERFLIVLAGTEKVFFNGILLIRGFDYDYTIDYNRAEITFSPTRVVARDSRVIVEFEYTDISYLRSLYATQTEFRGNNWSVNFNFYAEQDSKSSTGDIQLDSTDISILETSGDDISKSVRAGFRRISEEEKKEANRIFYFGIEDPVSPGQIILQFTSNKDSAQYTAVFSEVGAGKGDYNIDISQNRNARIYTYVGKNNGSYLPVIQLIPPEKKQLITLNGKYQINKNTDIFAEVALSNLDKNRRSPINNDDNTGIATHFMVNKSIRLDTSGRWILRGNVRHEFVQKYFNALNPFRVAEFTRDWNILQILQTGDEHLINSKLVLSNSKGFSTEYGFNFFNRAGIYQGNKHEGTIKYEDNRWMFKAFSTALLSSAALTDQQSAFVRPNVILQYALDKTKKWSVGSEIDAESNKIRGISIDTLSRRSYAFEHLKWFVTSDFTRDVALKLSYSTRNDHFGKNNVLNKASNAREVEIAGKWLASSDSDLQWSIIGRDLKIIDPDLLPNDKSKRTILGRLDYMFAVFNKGIRSTTSYNTNSGQEPKIEYVFQKVEVGQGDYFYIGNSETPVLNNLLDFRYDPTNPLSDYIRLTLTNNEFIRTNNIEVNQSIAIDPSKFAPSGTNRKLSKPQLFISKFTALSNIKVTKKKLDGTETPLISFLDFRLDDTTLVAYNASYANTLFYNRGHVKYDMQIGNRINQNRIVQVNGKEDRGLDDLFFRARWNVKNMADIYLVLEKSLKTFVSQAFNDRNLQIETYRFKPELSIRPTSNTRYNIRYNYQDKKQQILTGDYAYINEFSTEFTFRKASEYSVNMSLSYVHINFSGKANSPIEYDMLEGLKNGKNYLWNFVYTRRLGKNIELTLNYEGRKTGISPDVHVGRAQIKATF